MEIPPASDHQAVVITKQQDGFTFLKTLPGVLKVTETALSLLAFICALVPRLRTSMRVICFLMVSFVAFVISGCLLLSYLMQWQERYSHVPWLRIEFLSCLAFAALYLVTSASLTPWGGFLAAYAASVVFGFSAMTCYIIDTILKFQVWRTWELNRRALRHRASSMAPSNSGPVAS